MKACATILRQASFISLYKKRSAKNKQRANRLKYIIIINYRALITYIANMRKDDSRNYQIMQNMIDDLNASGARRTGEFFEWTFVDKKTADSLFTYLVIKYL